MWLTFNDVQGKIISNFTEWCLNDKYLCSNAFVFAVSEHDSELGIQNCTEINSENVCTLLEYTF